VEASRSFRVPVGDLAPRSSDTLYLKRQHPLQCYSDSTMTIPMSPPVEAALSAPANGRLVGSVGRRDRKKQATRQALRNAALQLVAEQGFANVTIEDITEVADVAPRTFFNYFPSKESAVIGADPERVALMQVSLIGRPSHESPLEALRAVLVEYTTAIAGEVDDLGEGREAWFRRFCAVRDDPDLRGAYVAHVSELEGGIVDALSRRLGKDPARDPYPALVTATVFAAARVAALYWTANGGVDSLHILTGAAIDTLGGGLVDEEVFVVTSPGTSNSKQPAVTRRPPQTWKAGRTK
jgi:AcrR family transcriptional regulator